MSTNDKSMKVVILCGGKGIRAFPFTNYLPKPMIPIGGSPIIAQLIKSFIHQGFTQFILAAGYRKAVLEDYFEGKDLGGATIDIVDTGEESNTGDRIYSCRGLVGKNFIVTYGDGLCNVPLNKLVDYHHTHQGLATMVSVPMYSQYGVLALSEDGCVELFREKPLIREHWINAGFIVFDKKVFQHWKGSDLEREVLPNLINKRLLYAYRHQGFFKSLDSYKDSVEFEEIVDAGDVPWLAKEIAR